MRAWRSHWLCTLTGRHTWRDVWTERGRKGSQCRRCYLHRWPAVDPT